MRNRKVAILLERHIGYRKKLLTEYVISFLKYTDNPVGLIGGLSQERLEIIELNLLQRRNCCIFLCFFQWVAKIQPNRYS